MFPKKKKKKNIRGLSLSGYLLDPHMTRGYDLCGVLLFYPSLLEIQEVGGVCGCPVVPKNVSAPAAAGSSCSDGGKDSGVSFTATRTRHAELMLQTVTSLRTAPLRSTEGRPVLCCPCFYSYFQYLTKLKAIVR